MPTMQISYRLEHLVSIFNLIFPEKERSEFQKLPLNLDKC